MKKNGKKPWIGIDLDGTLAEYHEWRGYWHIGDPIPAMVKKLLALLRDGYEVKVFTARVAEGEHAVQAIRDWFRTHGLPELEITNVKDYACLQIWDDRAKQVVVNTGMFLEENCPTAGKGSPSCLLPR